MSRSQETLPDSSEGHEARLVRVQRRTGEIFRAPLAQDPAVLSMGTRMTIWLSKEDLSLRSLDMPAADRVQLAYLAMLIRPFSLQREAIHNEKVVKSLLHFASTESQQVMSRQLTKMWETVPVARMHMFASEAGRELIPGGTSDGEVADRVLYSQIAHADDAATCLTI